RVGARPKPKSIAVALLPDQCIRERLRSQKEHLPLLGEVGDCKADMGENGAGQEIDLLRIDQLGCLRNRDIRLAGIVAGDDLELAAEHAALLVDLVAGELPALAIAARTD